MSPKAAILNPCVHCRKTRSNQHECESTGSCPHQLMLEAFEKKIGQ